jgi:hypothetical protein
MSNENRQESDPAAVFAAALSLWQACHAQGAADTNLNFSESYNGFHLFMREVMRVATLFETWACRHIEFNEFTEVWPYFLEDRFGERCMSAILPTDLASFDESDCLRVAMRMRLPIRYDGRLPLPVDLTALNPLANSPFKKFRIQTMRNHVEDEDASPYTADDEPFDGNYSAPYFALYGIGDDGLLEHIADRATYEDALDLARKFAPGVNFSKSE